MFSFLKKNQEDKTKKTESIYDELLEKGLQYFNKLDEVRNASRKGI